MQKNLHSRKLVVILFTLLLVLIGFLSKTQVIHDTVYTWMDTVKVCPCQTPSQNIIIPIKFRNFDSISSVNISILYRTSALQYNGYQNLNPAIPFPIINNTWAPTLSKVQLTSFGMGCGSIPDDGIMVELKFKVLCDTTTLMFEMGIPGANLYGFCNPIFPDTLPLPAVFINGAVIGGFAITTQPVALTVHEYQSAQFTCSTNLAVGIPTYQWQVKPDSASPWSDLTNNALYNNVNNSTLNIPQADLGFNGFAFRCRLGGCLTYEYSNPAILTVLDSIIPSSGVIEGFVTYDNNSSSPLGNALVTLKQNNVLIFNTFSDSTGHYSFTNLTPGNYELEASPVHPFGGINSTDGLSILKHFTGLSLLNELPLIASDVDANGATNSIDALMCVERFVGMINSFPAGDWVSEKPLVICNGVNAVTQAVKVLCVGDVDRSYIP